MNHLVAIPDKIKEALSATSRIEKGSKPDLYLRGRGIDLNRFPKDLRMDKSENMVAIIRDRYGEIVSYQKTILGQDKHVRLMAKGVRIPYGSAIRLFNSSEVMGVAEGTETSLSAASIFKVPVWAALNTQGMERWLPPKCVRHLMIFADDDRSLAGEKAARNLCDEVGARGIKVTIHKPELNLGSHLRPSFGDWNDVLKKKNSAVISL